MALIALVALLLASASLAGAATVVNGDFETGNLGGWQVSSETEEGTWLAGSGTIAPLSLKPVPAPFQGGFDALADEDDESSMILYQDVALEPGYSHQLSLELYYRSYNPIEIPTPDTLNFKGSEGGGPPQPNQQVRVDVMKAGSPVASLNPGDILTTLLATPEGAPEEIGWTRLSADLSPFAGQTVRIRIAAVDNQFFLNVGVDSVAIASTPPPVPPAPTPPPAEPHCVVPKLVGKKLKVAKKKLRKADCTLGKVTKKKGITAKSGKVVKQRPKPETEHPAGSKVAVTLGR